MAWDIGLPTVSFILAVIVKCTNVLMVLGISFVKRTHSQLIIDQFQILASVAVALRRFLGNPQPGLAKCGISKVKQFGIISVGIGFPCSLPRIFQVYIIDISSFDNCIPLDYLLV